MQPHTTVRSFISRAAFAAAAALPALALPAHAAYPDHPIRLILPFVPGGSTDLVARTVANKAQDLIGQTLVIENRGGAGGIIATDAVAKAAPDGYTLLFTQTSHGSNPSLMLSLPYNTEKDFTAISLLADHPGVLLSHPSKPYKTFIEFLAYAKANPGKVIYASAGRGTWPHLTMEMLAQQAGLNMIHVPYKGAAPSRVDLIAGVVDVKVEAYSTSADFIKDGRLRALAVTGAERISFLPNIPTIAESGFKGFNSSIWMGILGPANMPPEIVAKLEKAFNDAAHDPVVVKTLSAQNIYSRGLPAKAMADLIHTDIIKWQALVKAAGIKPE
ncbi:MAG TPA: tripartite tricarboxylate transporter substrate binding protein [Burkholderiales bacterium]|nr:tripartite tricarboxylate transporter substrate binding protein [Burkholderiales bacterium]